MTPNLPPPPPSAIQPKPLAKVQIKPLSQMLPEVFAYPLKADPAIVTGIIAVCSLLGMLGGLLSLIVTFGLLAYLFRYSSSVLSHTAAGNMEPPEHTHMSTTGAGWEQIWLIIAFLFVGFGSIFLVGPAIASGLCLLMICLYPAAAMMVAMEESFTGALQPGRWLQIIARIGPSYGLAVLFLILATVSKAYVADWLDVFMPRILAVLLYNLVSSYLTIASFFMMGYLLYVNHDALGLEVEAQPDSTLGQRRAAVDPDQTLLDECEAMQHAGQPERAAVELGSHIKARGGSTLVHSRYRGLLAQLGQQAKLLEHGKSWLSALIAQEKWHEAKQLYEECLRLDTQFRPAQGEEFLPLAQALAGQQPDSALTLLNGFQTRFPKSKLLPKTMLFAAKILAEQKNQAEPAKKIVAWLVANFPQHPDLPAIEAYGTFLQRLVPATPPPQPGSPAAP
jgi:hypothetical protein